jgi:hypothetical protein
MDGFSRPRSFPLAVVCCLFAPSAVSAEDLLDRVVLQNHPAPFEGRRWSLDRCKPPPGRRRKRVLYSLFVFCSVHPLDG